MKKLLLATLALILGSCATINSKQYTNLTLDNIVKECKPDQIWNLSTLGMPAQITISSDCLSIKKLFLVQIRSEDYTEDIRKHTVELLKLHYLYFNKNQAAPSKKDPPPGTVEWKLKELKKEVNSEANVTTYFYELTYVEVK